MIYGLYLSATGVLTNSYRQDVIANNIANAETVGFKRDLSLFKARLTAAQEVRQRSTWSNPQLELLGGGTLTLPTQTDSTQGELEGTGNNFDVAIQGSGYFHVRDGQYNRLTRNGRLTLDRQGTLVLATGGQKVLDIKGKSIKLDPALAAQTIIGQDGRISQGKEAVAQIAVVDVPQGAMLRKQGATLLDYANVPLRPSPSSTLHSQFVERSNVEPTTELTALMDCQRQLEANANMIRYQDQALAKLVNEVGKIT